ncbi:OLC1v1033705C5 [Oldenlandia corymbosa var. corymbosa]|uniref:OLC1v1033705C5 n=1 Tax=Oldenlandia corymbosa var. corymbosa TaxID=529605 RepID=A0AAV1CQA4_OLDCO|nr:OLC1v1033705C5 [Oldenlandia corymbosa var. corymbosa]
MKTAKGKGPARKDTKEALKPVDDRKLGKRKADQSSQRRAAGKQKKGQKDPNKPKRPPSAFFVFLEEFRQTFKKENPNVKAVSAVSIYGYFNHLNKFKCNFSICFNLLWMNQVGKAGGQKWKSMSQAEKAPYEAKAAKRKAEYEKLINAYNKKQVRTFPVSLSVIGLIY